MPKPLNPDLHFGSSLQQNKSSQKCIWYLPEFLEFVFENEDKTLDSYMWLHLLGNWEIPALIYLYICFRDCLTTYCIVSDLPKVVIIDVGAENSEWPRRWVEAFDRHNILGFRNCQTCMLLIFMNISAWDQRFSSTSPPQKSFLCTKFLPKFLCIY